MRQPDRSGRVRNGTGCSAGVRRSRLGRIPHRQASMMMPSLAPFEEGVSVAMVRMELARALRQLLRATDYREACEAVVHNPILLVESASELLQATVDEARRSGDVANEAMLANYLKVLELARETSILSANDEANSGN